MRLPLSWLREYVDCEADASQLAERLTVAGLEVEEILRPGEAYQGITIGEVLSVEPHPDADTLSLCTVTTGGEPTRVVCGAPNVAAGQRVPFAPVGSVLPGGMKLKRVKIRGQESHGMICSEAELETGEDAAGIMVLPPDAPLGEPFAAWAGLEDDILDIDVPPNRPDALSIYGLAREVAALYSLPLAEWNHDVIESGSPAADEISVEVADLDDCPRYSARLIRGVTVGTSPAWLAGRLRSVGLRPINSIVDITNLIMIEFGQPQHVFDLARVGGGRIVVRRAGAGEHLMTLDEQTRKLDPEILLITDGDGALAVAGIMGGRESQVDDGTTDILLESAHFDPVRIRIGGSRLGLLSDSRTRFERGTDPTLTARTADRAAALMAELAGGTVAPGVVEAVSPGLDQRRVMVMRTEWIDALLGVRIEPEDMTSILTGLGFGIQTEDQNDRWQVTVPPWRPDIEGEAHLGEEIARVIGYDQVGSDDRISGGAPSGPTRLQRLREHVRDTLVGLGLWEIVTDSRLEKGAPAPLRPETEPVVLLNPLGEDSSELRRDLAPGVLRTVGYNQRRQAEDVRLFEIGMVHNVAGGQPLEEEWVMAALTGFRLAERWPDPEARFDFADLSGLLTALWRALDITNPELVPATVPGCAPGTGVGLRWEKPEVSGTDEDGEQPRRFEAGMAGRLAREWNQAFDLEGEVWFFAFPLARLESLYGTVRRYQGLTRHPASDRDLSLIVPAGVGIGTLLARLESIPRVESARLFDEYAGEQIPEGMTGVLINMRYRDKENTLSDKEIDTLHKKVVKACEADFGARLRT